MSKKLLMIFSMMIVVGICTGFSSTTPSKWAEDGVYKAVSKGYVQEEIQGDYTEPITRKEFAILFTNTLFYKQDYKKDSQWRETRNAYLTKESYLELIVDHDFDFIDVDHEDVKLAYLMGLTNGINDYEFGPNHNITREQAATMIINGVRLISPMGDGTAEYHLGDLNKVSPWAKDSVKRAFDLELIKGVTDVEYDKYWNVSKKAIFDPKGNFTREQAILIMERILDNWRLGDYLSFRGLYIISGETSDYRFIVSKNEVTNVGDIYDGSGGHRPSRMYFQHVNAGSYGNSDIKMWDMFPEINYEHTIVADPYAYWLYNLHVPEQLYRDVEKEKYAKYDIGYATYEIFGDDFLFKITNKNNGDFSLSSYGGRDSKRIPFTKLK